MSETPVASEATDQVTPIETPSDINVTTPVETPSDTSWYDNFDADLKNHPSVTKFESQEELAKSYVNLEKMVGKDKIVVPTEKSTPEEWADFYSKTGRPAEMTGYETPDLDIQDNLKMSDPALESFKQKAHELGLNNKQFAELYGYYNTQNQTGYNSALQAAADANKQTQTELRGEWGDAYEAKTDGAQKALDMFFKGKINESNQAAFNQLANSKGFIEGMVAISEQLGEDVIQGGAKNTQSPSEAQSELNSILMDSKHAYHDNSNPEHMAAVDKFISLQMAASAGK